MSFAPLLGKGSPSYIFIKSTISFLAALCSSILDATVALIDDLTPPIPQSWCLVCKINGRGHSHDHTEAKRTAFPSDRGTGSYILKKLKDTDGESATIAVVFNSRTKTYSLKKLEDIDGEAALRLIYLPSLPPPTDHHPHSGKSHLPRLPPQLGGIGQSPPPRRNNQTPQRSPPRRRDAAQDPTTPAPAFARRRHLHHTRS